MAFSPSFTASPQVGNPSVIILTDTSTGSDVNITTRHVYFRKSDGLFLVPTGTTTDYVVWDYADQTATVDLLEKDRALWITVEWIDVSNQVLYSSVSLDAFTTYNEDFDYSLTTILNSNPLLINDNSFRINKTDLRLFIDSGDKAALRASDIEGAQLSYDQATNIRLASVYYFNESTA